MLEEIAQPRPFLGIYMHYDCTLCPAWIRNRIKDPAEIQAAPGTLPPTSF